VRSTWPAEDPDTHGLARLPGTPTDIPYPATHATTQITRRTSPSILRASESGAGQRRSALPGAPAFTTGRRRRHSRPRGQPLAPTVCPRRSPLGGSSRPRRPGAGSTIAPSRSGLARWTRGTHFL
jgi:hypothetical protein